MKSFLDLAALLEEGETLEELMNLSPEELLLRYFVSVSFCNKNCKDKATVKLFL